MISNRVRTRFGPLEDGRLGILESGPVKLLTRAKGGISFVPCFRARPIRIEENTLFRF